MKKLRIEGFCTDDAVRFQALIDRSLKKATDNFSMFRGSGLFTVDPLHLQADHVVVVYRTPGWAVSSGALQGQPPCEALDTWCTQADKALKVARIAPDCSVFIKAEAIFFEPDLHLKPLAEMLDFTLGCESLPGEEIVASSEDDALTQLLMPAAERWIARHPRVVTRLRALEDETLGRELNCKPFEDSFEFFVSRFQSSSGLGGAFRDEGDLQERYAVLSSAFELCVADLTLATAQNSSATPPASSVLGPRQILDIVAARLRRRRDLNLVRNCGLFDSKWYQEQYPDVLGENDPAMHFLIHGGREGRSPGPGFSSLSYLRLNPDLKGRAINPLVHYLRRGRREARPALTISGQPIENGDKP